MKKINILQLIVALLILFASCEEQIAEPKADFKITYTDVSKNKLIEISEPYTIKAGQLVNFVNIGEGDKIVYWTGDEKHDYSKRLPEGTDEKYIKKDSGDNADENGDYSYAYKEPGIYSIVMIATTNKNLGEEILVDIVEKQINVEQSIEE